jgi:Spy/CpxP family protein refolding chaperone
MRWKKFGAVTNRTRHAWPATFLLATVLTPLIAAPNPGPPPSRSPGDAKEVRESLQNLMIASMKKALDLSRDQQVEVIPQVEQVFEERERYARQRREALRLLQAKLLEESVPEKDYRDQVTHLDDLERAHRDRELRLRAEIDRSLNPRQRAQLRVFVPRFRREMQMRIDEARSVQPRRVTPPRPPTPPDPQEWESDDEEF